MPPLVGPPGRCEGLLSLPRVAFMYPQNLNAPSYEAALESTVSSRHLVRKHQTSPSDGRDGRSTQTPATSSEAARSSRADRCPHPATLTLTARRDSRENSDYFFTRPLGCPEAEWNHHLRTAPKHRGTRVSTGKWGPALAATPQRSTSPPAYQASRRPLPCEVSHPRVAHAFRARPEPTWPRQAIRLEA